MRIERMSVCEEKMRQATALDQVMYSTVWYSKVQTGTAQ